MSVTKLQDRDEFVRWYTEGKTYSWIIDTYREKYDTDIGSGTISNWRHQLGLERRAVVDTSLIPWEVKPEHRINHILNMLRSEGRRRGGQEVAPRTLAKLEAWLAGLAADDAVAHYDPDTEQGWWIVKRRPGIDTDIIRKPDGKTRTRGVRE